jgi:ribosomal-protein-serine acetyltransferase
MLGGMADVSDTTDERLPERVDTPRLVLRRWRHDEVGIMAAAVATSIDHLRPWMSWIKVEPLTHLERVQLIERWTRVWEDGGDVVYGVFLDGDVVGSSGFHRRQGLGTLEIGYWIHVDHVRHGYATELTAALTTTAFEIHGIEVVHVQTDEANEASAAVPAKLGFSRARIIEREPEAPAESGRLIDWTMTADVWATRAAG